MNKILMLTAAAVLSLAGFAWATSASAATNQLYLTQSCLPDGSVRVKFDWSGNDPSARQQWLDLSLFDNGWQWGSFLGSGPMPAWQQSLTWDGLISNATHYVRINQELTPGVWDPSPTYYWTTINCPGPVQQRPAAPSNLRIDGPLPDLSVPVPPGQGELGRITVSWQDNSNNETGFRLYQDCNGNVTRLAEFAANETSYGPLQVCRPGRVGISAFNAYGESQVVWSPVPHAVVPAAPTNLHIDGPLPDLSIPVPPGQGELGRITVSWRDNSSNETGFRIYEDCNGTVTRLLAVEANETQYGPLQVCRPGRVGVSAVNAYGESSILWSPVPHPAAPASPSNLDIDGALPDLGDEVPPGQGELGRITVSWNDNSSNESGFRIYQDCNGTVTQLLDVDANETSYGPLQVCRPGRVGVAAYNGYGESAVLWSPQP